jgi:glycyl-tRNA synthetase beta chain
LRVEALNEFTKSADSKSLIESNKRIANILKDSTENHNDLNSAMLIEDSEKNLYKATELLSNKLLDKKDYKTTMRSLLDLKELIDTFFDNVMVNTDDLKVRKARLALINQVRVLFLSVADISHLSS